MSVSNRPIKFRLFQPHGGEWESPQFAVGGNYFVLTLDGKLLVWNKETETDSHGGKLVLQQFTGMRDVDGNEIYEGDIIERLPKSKYPYSWVVDYTVDEGFGLCSTAEYRILGNVCENPELIPNDQ